MARPVTAKEQRAIDALQKVADKWPNTLKLFSAAGTLLVLSADENFAGPGNEALAQDAPLATIYGISNDGGDPW